MDRVASLNPVLPPELERQIFQLCARSRPVMALKLMLVAWRVKYWVEPLLYRTIIIHPGYSIEGYPTFTEENFSALLRSKPADFFRNSVRHLLLEGVQDEFMGFVLQICTGALENLMAYSANNVLARLSTTPFPLKHLYINYMPNIPSTSPLFAQLTHLELLGPNEDISATVSLLPRLTHLSLYEGHQPSERFVPHYLSILQSCRSLSVLISLQRPSSRTTNYPTDLLKDPRFVVLVRKFLGLDLGWKVELLDGTGYWSQAETFIAQRRSGEIDTEEYRINRAPG